jgi:signal-transduction protein with cAMP-binding, CBS, and nucleotidyltransferase domain
VASVARDRFQVARTASWDWAGPHGVGCDVRGVVTDRDIAVRGIAEELDPATTRLADIITHDLVVVSPNDDVETAVELMRTHAVRRLPVLDGEQPVGIVSLGDLAIERDSDSVLAQISAEEPNN